MDLGYFDHNKYVYSVSHYILTKFGKYAVPEAPTRQMYDCLENGIQEDF